MNPLPEYPKKTDPAECRPILYHMLPTLVLALKSEYQMEQPELWKPIVHQGGGHGCHPLYIYGMVLLPRPDILETLKEIERHWYDTDAGVFKTTLDEVIEYRTMLKTLLKVDCNHSYHDFMEGIYPIDCDVTTIRRLAISPVPDNLDDLIVFENGIARMSGIIGRWSLYILGESHC
jgi:hypothetical protein